MVQRRTVLQGCRGAPAPPPLIFSGGLRPPSLALSVSRVCGKLTICPLINTMEKNNTPPLLAHHQPHGSCALSRDSRWGARIRCAVGVDSVAGQWVRPRRFGQPVRAYHKGGSGGFEASVGNQGGSHYGAGNSSVFKRISGPYSLIPLHIRGHPIVQMAVLW
jgi:hypothetical protein